MTSARRSQLRPQLLALLLLAAGPLSGRSAARKILDDAPLSSEEATTTEHRADWAYPIAALRNPHEGLVRIYGQFLPSVVGNDTERNERSQVAGCFFSGTRAKHEVARLKRPVETLSYWDSTNVSDYIIDCEDPGPWAKKVVIRLQNGTDIGDTLNIIDMERDRQGSVFACTQPVFTDRPWFKDWVLHQFIIGMDAVLINKPVGPHIDDLFNAQTRDKRIQYNGKLAERSPLHVGTKPVETFDKNGVTWFEYQPSPTAFYYAEELLFTICHYRNRYAYEYGATFDIDEFWTPTTKSEDKRVSTFMDTHMPSKASQMAFTQINYPLDCPTRKTGQYAKRFTLHWPGDSQSKVIARSIAVRRMHVHGLLDTTKEWQQDHKDEDWNYHVKIPTELAFLKHIRPSTFISEEDNALHHQPCMFGIEADPNGEFAIE